MFLVATLQPLPVPSQQSEHIASGIDMEPKIDVAHELGLHMMLCLSDNLPYLELCRLEAMALERTFE